MLRLHLLAEQHMGVQYRQYTRAEDAKVAKAKGALDGAR